MPKAILGIQVASSGEKVDFSARVPNTLSKNTKVKARQMPMARLRPIPPRRFMLDTATAIMVSIKADAGMVPAGKDDISPALNAVQTMIAVKEENDWKISVFQNTPAAFHALPELAERMTADLREVLKKG